MSEGASLLLGVIQILIRWWRIEISNQRNLHCVAIRDLRSRRPLFVASGGSLVVYTVNSNGNHAIDTNDMTRPNFKRLLAPADGWRKAARQHKAYLAYFWSPSALQNAIKHCVNTGVAGFFYLAKAAAHRKLRLAKRGGILNVAYRHAVAVATG